MQYPGAGKLPRDQNSVPAAGAASKADIDASVVNATVLPLVIDNVTNRLLVTAEITSTSLPTGAATLAEQQTQTTKLTSIDGKLPALGQALAAASLPVVLTAAQMTTLTPLSTVGVNNAAGASAVNIQDGGNSITIDGSLTTLTTLTNITNWGNIVDNAAFTDGTTRLLMAGFIFDEVAGTALTENDGGAARIDSKRSIVNVLEDATTRGTRLNIVVRDLAAGAADTGIMAYGVRRTADTTPVSADGDVHPMVFDDLGNLKVNIKAGGAGDGTILDGVNNTIKVTVFDYANSNPLGVVLRDTNGDYVSVGGGTQYTEDVASPADPIGTAMATRRRDSLASEVTTDGDWIIANSTSKGELYVKHVDTIPVTKSGTWDITNAGTFAVQPAGSVAHDGVGTGVNPILVGAYASAAAPADVSADGDATRIWVLRNGAQASVLTAAGALIGGDAANGLDVDVTRLPALVAGAAIIGKVGIDQTTPGTTNLVALAANQSVNVAQMNGVTVTMGNGASGTGVQRVTIASDSTGAIIVNGPQAQDAAITGNPLNNGGRASTATPSAMSADGDSVYLWLDRSGATVNTGYVAQDAAVAGNPVLGGARGSTAIPTAMSADGDSVFIRSTLNGEQITTPSATAARVGVSIYWNSALGSTKAAANASAGNLYGYHIYNPNTTVAYVQFFNTASASVTVGTTPPVMVLAVPPLGWADAPPSGPPIDFGTAMTVAATTTSTGSGNPTTGLMVNLWYK